MFFLKDLMENASSNNCIYSAILHYWSYFLDQVKIETIFQWNSIIDTD